MREFGELKLWGYIMSKIKLTLLASGLILSLGMQPTSKADEENKIYFPGSETDFLKSDDLSWDKIPQHYVPSKGIGDWQKLYTKRPKQWKEGYSAYELAHSWENANPDLPPEITALFYGSVELLAATPEHKTPLLTDFAPSQSDVLAFIRINDRVCAVAVEGKVKEEFGTQTVGQWFKNPSPGKIERLKYISTTLGLSYPPPDEIRYQLLHRTASAVIEAQHFNTDCAAMIVQSFSPENKWFEDYSAFLGLFGIQSVKQGKLYKTDKPGITLYFGWAGSQKQPVAAVSDTAVAKTTTPSTLTVTQTIEAPISWLEWVKENVIGIVVGLIAVILIVGFVFGFTTLYRKILEKLERVEKSLGTNFFKGYKFEEYIKGRFNNPPFELYDNRESYPDFKLTYSVDGKNYPFAVECKWLSTYEILNDYGITNYKQLERYKTYEQNTKEKTFIVLGMNGSAHDPKHIFIIPVMDITTTKPTKEALLNYYYKESEDDTYHNYRFHYDYKNQSLSLRSPHK